MTFLLAPPYLGAELDEHHVLVWGGVPDDLHMLNHLVEGGHKLHEVVAGHGGRDSEDAEHGTAPHILLQGCHLAGDTAGTQLGHTATVTAALLSDFNPLLSSGVITNRHPSAKDEPGSSKNSGIV